MEIWINHKKSFGYILLGRVDDSFSCLEILYGRRKSYLVYVLDSLRFYVFKNYILWRKKMKTVYLGLFAILFSGCMLKSTVVKSLEPVDQALVIISAIDCSPLQVGSDAYLKCEVAKTQADMAHRILSELGVNPIK